MLTIKDIIEESRQFGRSSGTREIKRSKQEEIEISKISTLHFRTNVKGWKFNPSVHASAQAYDRRPEFEQSDWMQLHKNVVDKMESFNSMFQSGEYVFYSKSMNQAYVAAVDSSKKELRIITTLPKGKSEPRTRTTKRMIIEGIVIDNVFEVE